MLYSALIKLNEKINIRNSLFSGQSFLWSILSDSDDLYCSIIGSTFIIIKQLSDYIIEVKSSHQCINGLTITDFIVKYFSVNIDSNSIFHKSFSNNYYALWSNLNDYLSLKILRQDPYETLISFMCAQGIGMNLIRKQVSRITETYGEKVSVILSDKEIILHKFPTPEKIASLNTLELSACTNNNRLRAANIVRVAQRVADGRIDLEALRDPSIPLAELRNTLCLNSGIGFKIADCIALFGLGRFDAFPIDTHVKQYLAKWFNSQIALRPLTPANYLLLDAEARTFLNSDFAGYAGHLLFHCWRKEVKKLTSF